MFQISDSILCAVAVVSAVMFVFLSPILMLFVGGAVAWPVIGLSVASFSSSVFGLFRHTFN
jgi:hypothetical protein